MKKIRIPRPSDRANVMLAVSFIGAVFSGFCSYCLLNNYYNALTKHYHTRIEEISHDIESWIENCLTGSFIGIIAAIFLIYIAFYLLWYVGYLITREK